MYVYIYYMYLRESAIWHVRNAKTQYHTYVCPHTPTQCPRAHTHTNTNKSKDPGMT